jgi:hypothetical protein
MGVRRTLAAALAAPLLLLAACGGTDTSIADPPISPDATTSSPTGQPHRESPEHFIRRWVAEDTRMQNTGDTSAFRSMSQNCLGCVSVARRVEGIYGAGGFVKTDGWSLMRQTQSAHHGQKRTIELLVDSAPTTYVSSKGASPQHLKGGHEHFQVEIVPTSNSWAVTQFVQVAS